MKTCWGSVVLCLTLLSGCLRPASERVELDRKVGQAEADGVSVNVSDGLAAVRSLSGERLVLWAQAPILEIEVSVERAQSSFQVAVHNCMEGAVLSHAGGVVLGERFGDRKASCRFEVPLAGEDVWRIAPPDAALSEPYVFAVLSDVQRGVDDVNEIFARMNEDPELRFVVSTGDLANVGTRPELVRFQRELAPLNIPFFSTVGNHEMGAPPRHWHNLFGPFNPHFQFKGVAFSLIDSGNATIDPDVYDWLDSWLARARDEVHVVLTHIPPLDPVGVRGGGFRSRKEAAKLLALLAKGKVDALFLGHIHSYYAFSAAGLPIYLSGGGGAIQERLDGIERHYLRVRVTPGARIEDVAIVRID